MASIGEQYPKCRDGELSLTHLSQWEIKSLALKAPAVFPGVCFPAA